MTSKCPYCILYIHDTLQHSLPVTHPHKDHIRLEKLTSEQLMTMANSMDSFLRLYKGHHNLALRLLRDTRAVQIPTLGDGTCLSVYEKILSWYKYMQFGKKEKHALAREIDFLAVEAVSCGFIQTRQTEDPLEVFKKWYLDVYFSMIEHLDDIHREHSTFVTLQKDAPLVIEDLDDIYN